MQLGKICYCNCDKSPTTVQYAQERRAWRCLDEERRTFTYFMRTYSGGLCGTAPRIVGILSAEEKMVGPLVSQPVQRECRTRGTGGAPRHPRERYWRAIGFSARVHDTRYKIQDTSPTSALITPRLAPPKIPLRSGPNWQPTQADVSGLLSSS